MIFSSLILLLFVGVARSQIYGNFSANLRKCHPDYEVQCGNGFCINLLQWCDSVVDCSDGSDEKGCDRGGADAAWTSLNESAVVRAAKYFLRQRNADSSWAAFTPRAVVALSFASRASPVLDEEKEQMKKQLDVQLLFDLMQNPEEMSLSKLALYVNALYATCQDPRHFQGRDLVARLRSDTDNAMRTNSTVPLAFLTLCIAGELTRDDANHMAILYNNYTMFERLSSKALIVMAMICHDMEKTPLFRFYVNDFFSHRLVETDVYSKALFMQASLAAGKSISLQTLLSAQLSDGSFGDMLSTYYAIPVLMNSSLLDIKCNNTTNIGMSRENLLAKRNEDEKHLVAYSLWISTDTDREVNSHSLTLTYDADLSFFEVMQIAASRHPLFQFLYDESDDGKKVYSLAGIPNDSESGKLWKLYRGPIKKVAVNSMQNLHLEKTGVDRIFPANKSHFVFWLKRDV